MENVTIKGFEAFEKFIKQIEHDINCAVYNIIKEIQVPRQVELNNIDIPLHSVREIGNSFNSYIVGNAKISAQLYIK